MTSKIWKQVQRINRNNRLIGKLRAKLEYAQWNAIFERWHGWREGIEYIDDTIFYRIHRYDMGYYKDAEIAAGMKIFNP